MKDIFIIGLGLIGGSISLAIKKEDSFHVKGFDLSAEQLRMAKSLGVIDEKVKSIEEGAVHADLIVLAVPVAQTIELIQQLNQLDLKKDVIITDVGSTKQEIVQAAAQLNESITFIGGHPMAGSHKSGVEAAKAHLFENAFYIFTPTATVDREQLITLKNVLKHTKARFLQMDAKQHDKLVGAVSHFPHIIAASLVHQLEKLQETDPGVTRLAAGGFRDITRIASSSPVMWRDILLHNQEELLHLFDQWQNEMNRARNLVQDGDGEGLLTFFQQARSFREGLPQRNKGAIPAFYDLFVDVPDHPGVISDVTYILAEHEISLTNIRILEAREDIMGVLRLSFRSEMDRDLAKKALKKRLYETYE
ncbi:prephenate dehydrogenase [Alkalihalobacillus xiaoxiensis]|uniref:Prephenate dehydrogenase n=1 Tax=Shouchella xiaoxiensis TaxID=766895 RepID=A0ABS2SXA1_9BACI|nr:prephenate dehydrogenase [Shouchella xiaoxiensis]MBM7840168.1 prephenate dehydrogenase [Shouchella xiaoxiensis]